MRRPKIYLLVLDSHVKFMFSKKATKIDEIFTGDLPLCSKCQIDGEDFVNFCGLFRKHELYICTCFSDDVVNMGENQIMGSTYTNIA